MSWLAVAITLCFLGVAIGIPPCSCGCECPKCTHCRFVPGRVSVLMDGNQNCFNPFGPADIVHEDIFATPRCQYNDEQYGDDWCSSWNREYILDCFGDTCCYGILIPDPGGDFDRDGPFLIGSTVSGYCCSGVGVTACIVNETHGDPLTEATYWKVFFQDDPGCRGDAYFWEYRQLFPNDPPGFWDFNGRPLWPPAVGLDVDMEECSALESVDLYQAHYEFDPMQFCGIGTYFDVVGNPGMGGCAIPLTVTLTPLGAT